MIEPIGFARKESKKKLARCESCLTSPWAGPRRFVFSSFVLQYPKLIVNCSYHQELSTTSWQIPWRSKFALPKRPMFPIHLFTVPILVLPVCCPVHFRPSPGTDCSFLSKMFPIYFKIFCLIKSIFVSNFFGNFNSRVCVCID